MVQNLDRNRVDDRLNYVYIHACVEAGLLPDTTEDELVRITMIAVRRVCSHLNPMYDVFLKQAPLVAHEQLTELRETYPNIVERFARQSQRLAPDGYIPSKLKPKRNDRDTSDIIGVRTMDAIDKLGMPLTCETYPFLMIRCLAYLLLVSSDGPGCLPFLVRRHLYAEMNEKAA